MAKSSFSAVEYSFSVKHYSIKPMKKTAANIDDNGYKSIRYLNLFRLLLSLFFFSIIFEKLGSFIGFSYTLDIARFIASLYLTFSILTWIISALFKQHSVKIGVIALIIDLPIIIALTLLFDGLNAGWVILPVITIGSFSMLSRRPYAILAMPIVATLLLWITPNFIGIEHSQINSSSILLYAVTYFAIALVGLRQSQTYTQTLLLAQKRKSRIVNLSQLNKLIIAQMQSGVVAFDHEYNVILINNKAKELIKISNDQVLPTFLIKKIIATPNSSHNNLSIHGEDVIIHLINQQQESDLSLLFIEEQKQVNAKSQQINLATLGQLSATIAHELRNPMAAIYSAAQLLHESTSIRAEDRKLTEIIANQIERSNKIIEDILLMSKPHVANQIDINLFESLTKFQAEFCQQHNIDTS
ncbi:hypothetical protein MNBD_GAMMA01-128, partial [hydrothermal vent metagenome]